MDSQFGIGGGFTDVESSTHGDSSEMPTFYISAIYVSPSNTMGGNTKIAIEFVNELAKYYRFVIFTTEPQTFKNHLNTLGNVTIIEVPYPFKKKSVFSQFFELFYVYHFLRDYFQNNKLKGSDYFYSASDFGPDVVPVYILRKRWQFKWIASLYLFIPSPIENIKRGYGFPFFKYFLYYFYQKWIFAIISRSFWRCCITNDADTVHFPQHRRKDVLAVYGGVNTRQIEEARKSILAMRYSAVFCGRLHPQKGISQLLDIWAKVCQSLPSSRLAVIGNGDPEFESLLKRKAQRLGLTNCLEWLGYVNDVEKYIIYLQGRIFVHPTIYDNNGMVAAEALCAGLPVVMYDLDSLKSVYQEGTVKVPYGDQNSFAKAVIKLLSDDRYYENCLPSAEVVTKLWNRWKWKTRAELFRAFLSKEKVGSSVAA